MNKPCSSCIFGKGLDKSFSSACAHQETVVRFYNSCPYHVERHAETGLSRIDDKEIFEELQKRGYNVGFQEDENERD
ncbi:MAG: hypothetical protein EOM23_06030 [Candidatus Moranbacteria bacterium]|nr:hypothetical protein [Candidatus Moranbacteria bacterium]